MSTNLEACDVSTTGAQSRYAGEWGLASLVLAGVLIVAAFLTLMMMVFYLILVSQLRPSKADVQLALSITSALVGLFWITSLIAIVAGWIGTRAAWARCQPGGLPVVGLVLSVLSWLLWTAVTIALIGNILDFNKRGLI